jgi:hypothetical protein
MMHLFATTTPENVREGGMLAMTQTAVAQHGPLAGAGV